MAIPFRLRRTRAAYPRATAWRATAALTVVPPVKSDSFAASVRELRNIRRLKLRRLRLTPMRLGQRRAKTWLLANSVVHLSDSFVPPATRTFKRTWRYWRQR